VTQWPGAGARPTETERNVGHGHVFPRPDGRRSACGGPGMCGRCGEDSVHRAAHERDVEAATAPSLALLRDALDRLTDGDRPASRAALRSLLGTALDALTAALVPAEPPEPVVPGFYRDERAHSRACGLIPHGHGHACHVNCPTCHGRIDFEGAFLGA
jgi:hypothetical protein